MSAKNEFFGGPWDGDVTDVSRPEIVVKAKGYPHNKWIQVDVSDGTQELEIIDLDRPVSYTAGTYHFKLTRLTGRLRFAYIWVPLDE